MVDLIGYAVVVGVPCQRVAFLAWKAEIGVDQWIMIQKID